MALKPLRKPLAAALAGFFVIALLVVAVEFGLRLTFMVVQNYDIEMWNYARLLKQSVPDERSHVHRPFASARIMGAESTINSLGLRDREYSYDKPADTYRILVIGDSVTFGFGVRLEETYSKRLEKMLNDKYGAQGRRYEVISAGVGNYNTTQELAFLKLEGYKYKPDFVLLHYYINDAEPTQKEEENFLTRNSISLIFLKAMTYRLKAYYNPEKQFVPFYRSTFEGPRWDQHEKTLLSFDSTVREMGTELGILITPELHQLDPYPFADIHEKLRALFEIRGRKVIDATEALKREKPETLWNAMDDQHPNAKGHKIIAEYLFEKLETKQEQAK